MACGDHGMSYRSKFNFVLVLCEFLCLSINDDASDVRRLDCRLWIELMLSPIILHSWIGVQSLMYQEYHQHLGLEYHYHHWSSQSITPRRHWLFQIEKCVYDYEELQQYMIMMNQILIQSWFWCSQLFPWSLGFLVGWFWFIFVFFDYQWQLWLNDQTASPSTFSFSVSVSLSSFLWWWSVFLYSAYCRLPFFVFNT